MVTKIAGVEFCVFVDLPGQEASAQGAERHEADAEFLKNGQGLIFRSPPEKGILAL